MNSTSIDLPAPVQTKSKARVQRTRKQWKSLVDEFTSSGLTKTAFCKKHSIATSCLYRWQKVFEGQPALADFIDITQPVSQATPELSANDTSAQWQVELELGAGIVLRLRTS